jgi:hypothetical protein
MSASLFFCFGAQRLPFMRLALQFAKDAPGVPKFPGWCTLIEGRGASHNLLGAFVRLETIAHTRGPGTDALTGSHGRHPLGGPRLGEMRRRHMMPQGLPLGANPQQPSNRPGHYPTCPGRRSYRPGSHPAAVMCDGANRQDSAFQPLLPQSLSH